MQRPRTRTRTFSEYDEPSFSLNVLVLVLGRSVLSALGGRISPLPTSRGELLDPLAALIQRVRAKDGSAEADLHGRYRRFVERRLAEGRARRNWFWLEELDDAVQEVFIHFFQAIRDGKVA